jgi:hypothetical protein
MAGKSKKPKKSPGRATPKSVGSTPATTPTTPGYAIQYPSGKPRLTTRAAFTEPVKTPKPNVVEQGLKTKATKDGTTKPVKPKEDY